MCNLDGLTCPRDCFDVGLGSGVSGESLDALFASLAADGATDLDDWQRANLADGWHAGRADWEAFRQDKERGEDQPMPVVSDDEIPF